jgi:uncharacterized protein with NAD-binding domain and iron-sulfur cluster
MSGGLTRRGFLGAGAVAAVGAALPAPLRAARRPPSVAVLGGGVGGLTAAHELAERGFDVTVYERRALGGKARSVDVPGSASGGRRPLPGEHGMRTFPGFYQNLPDTLRRIPFGSNRNGVFDNLIAASQLDFARSGGRDDWIVPLTASSGWTVDEVRQSLTALVQTALRLGPVEAEYFADRLLVFLSSCDARRFGEWEHTSWWDFTAAGSFSTEYQRLLVGWINRQLLAVKAAGVSALAVAIFWEAGLYNLMGRSGTGPFDRLLELPTNEAWIDPWIALLDRLGVRFERGEVERLELRGSRIAGAKLADGRQVSADWFVLAVPAERAAPLLRGAPAATDPALGGVARLTTAWEAGIQFYLREQVPVAHGHVLHVDSPWAISSVSQAQFWPSRDFARDYGNGRVRDCISVDIADWTTAGTVYGRPARELAADQIAREVWEQMKQSLNDSGSEVLSDALLESWQLDPGVAYRGAIPTSEDPLLINTPGSWRDRPAASGRIPNLFLAADYVQTDINVACMEGANEAARRAVNALLDAAGSRAEPATVHPLYRPPEFEQLKRVDAQRYAQGQPNAFDAPPPPRAALPVRI